MVRRITLLSMIVAVTVLLAGLPGISAAQMNLDEVEITAEKVAENIYVLFGAGGNIGVCIGEDHVFMIDAQYAPLHEKIVAAVAELSDKPIRYLLNTHWHGDHVDGNEKLGAEGTIIVSHENVRERITTEQFLEVFNSRTPARPVEAWPVITFSRDITFHVNGEEIYIFNLGLAHTDGDAIVHFTKSNVIHMGDIYFEGMYPFIDVGAGGSITNMIKAVDEVLPMMDENTVVIPGHGPISDKPTLTAYRDMLAGIGDNIAALMEEGKSLEEITAAKPTAEFDEVWANGFLKPDLFVKIVYEGLAAE
jgi:cyclase